MLLLTLIFICLNLWIIYYLNHLKSINCVCALNRQRKIIMTFSSLLVILPLVVLVAKSFIKPYIMIYIPIAIAAGIINAVLILQYAKMIKKESCNCVDSDAANMLNNIAVGYLALYVLVFIGVTYIWIKLNQVKRNENITSKKK